MIDQVFLGKRPIDHWVKDREALLRDPRGSLGAHPVRIPGVSIRGLLVSCTAMLALTWGISLAEGEIFVEAIMLTLFLGALMVFAVVVSRGQELVLSPRGVELKTAWARTILPWDLFVVRGEPEAKTAALVMPFNESAAGRIEVYRSDKLWKRGAEETGLIKGGKLRLGVPYQVAPSDLGQLLLELGPRLEGATVPADEGSEAQPIPAGNGGELTLQEGSGLSFRLPRFALDGEDQGPAHDALFRLHPKLVRLLERTEAGRRGVERFRLLVTSAIALICGTAVLFDFGALAWIAERFGDRLAFMDPEEPTTESLRWTLELLAELDAEPLLWSAAVGAALALGISIRLRPTLQRAAGGR